MATVKTIAARKAAQARTTLNAYRRLFSTEDGQLVLRDLMRSCRLYSPSVGKDPYETYFNEGMRAVVLRVMETAKIDENQIENLAKALNEENASMFLE